MNKCLEPGFTGEFYQTFKEEKNPYPSQTVPKSEEEGRHPDSFYKATITPIPNQTKTFQYKKIIGQYPW